MKKIRSVLHFALMIAFASLLAIGFFGCPQPDPAVTLETSETSATSLQGQIDNVAAGSTVTLNSSLVKLEAKWQNLILKVISHTFLLTGIIGMEIIVKRMLIQNLL